uniref:NADH-ubiquinone oxidoreductase chain 6 n=1 Tax=Papyrocranus congoensis TaxID=311468 RepID=C4IX90_PAPCN|nr:NADH dehydrogenase subunit 6 [Papyrocranus congoensis]BAH58972.1 NADH dehydrogenase subunit 6 [Papyrocranus congoensis]
MADLFILCLVGMVLGLVAVASNPAPYYAALGLVLSAAAGCGVLIGCGGSFLSLVLFLIYLGGMMVVFAYSAALAAELFPETWGERSVFGYFMVYVIGLVFIGVLICNGWYLDSWLGLDGGEVFSFSRGEMWGVGLLYSFGGWMLMICGWVLLLTLFVVLELTRGLSRGTLRAV